MRSDASTQRGIICPEEDAMLPNGDHARLVYSVIRGASPDAAAPEHVRRSWQRCVDEYGLDPESKAQPVLVSHQELLVRKEQNLELVSLADAEMAHLYGQLAGSGHSIILTDRDGVLLSYRGDPSFRGAASRTGLAPGAVWSERYGGTNGMGTCLLGPRRRHRLGGPQRAVPARLQERGRAGRRAARAGVQHLPAGPAWAQPQEVVPPAAAVRGAPRRALFRHGAGTRVGAAQRRIAPAREPQRARRARPRRRVDGAQYPGGEARRLARRPDPADRRNRHGQGAFRPRLARLERARRARFRRGQLRRDPGGAAAQRAGAGPRRHAVPGRDRRAARGAAGPAAPGAGEA